MQETLVFNRCWIGSLVDGKPGYEGEVLGLLHVSIVTTKELSWAVLRLIQHNTQLTYWGTFAEVTKWVANNISNPIEVDGDEIFPDEVFDDGDDEDFSEEEFEDGDDGEESVEEEFDDGDDEQPEPEQVESPKVDGQ